MLQIAVGEGSCVCRRRRGSSIWMRMKITLMMKAADQSKLLVKVLQLFCKKQKYVCFR